MFKIEICMRVLPVSTLLIYKSGLVLVREEGIAGAGWGAFNRGNTVFMF